jgi:hypothetical protein
LQLADVLVLGLATWRIVNLLQRERGPMAILTRMRAALGVSHDEAGEPVGWPDTELGLLVRCPWCLSVWVGVGLAGVYLLWPGLGVALALPFALSAMALAVGGWVKDA